jgi:hypothetical protein
MLNQSTHTNVSQSKLTNMRVGHDQRSFHHTNFITINHSSLTTEPVGNGNWKRQSPSEISPPKQYILPCRAIRTSFALLLAIVLTIVLEQLFHYSHIFHFPSISKHLLHSFVPCSNDFGTPSKTPYHTTFFPSLRIPASRSYLGLVAAFPLPPILSLLLPFHPCRPIRRAGAITYLFLYASKCHTVINADNRIGATTSCLVVPIAIVTAYNYLVSYQPHRFTSLLQIKAVNFKLTSHIYLVRLLD